jgi:hypothetical protein
MTGEADTTEDTTTAASGDAALTGAPASSRPWTPAAAMEPVPPLAPPPARPGAGAHIATTPRRPRQPLGALSVAAFVAVALVLALVVGLVLAGR